MTEVALAAEVRELEADVAALERLLRRALDRLSAYRHAQGWWRETDVERRARALLGGDDG
jgi:hypothetical protein